MCKISWAIIVITLIDHLDRIDSHVMMHSPNNLPNQLVDTTKIINNNISARQPKGWMETATNAIAGPAGQMMVHFAKEMISRQAGNSQILSFNLTNLLILVFLKALIFSAGLIGAGNWSQYARGRHLDSPLIQPDEPPLYVGFLAAEGSGDYNCLHRAACAAPATATEYIKASKALIKGLEIFDTKISYNSHYRNSIQSTERAVMDGMAGAPCDVIYHCRL